MKYGLLWLLGVPIPVLIIGYLIFHWMRQSHPGIPGDFPRNSHIPARKFPITEVRDALVPLRAEAPGRSAQWNRALGPMCAQCKQPVSERPRM